MNRDELLRKLRTMELSIHTATFDQFVEDQGPETVRKVSALSFELRRLIIKLGNAQLAEIADKLEELSPELREGIAAMQKTIDELSNAKAVIDTFSNVLGLVARVVGFAATI